MKAWDDEVGRPAVSVVMVVEKQAERLRRAIASVVEQDFAALELLVVDDGSCDGSAAVVERFGRDDPRVRYFRHHRSSGVNGLRNRGLREGCGELIAFADASVEWLPGTLSRQVEFFSEAPAAVGLLYSGALGCGERLLAYAGPPRGDCYALLLEKNVMADASRVMLRREVVERIGGFDEGLAAIGEWDYWIRIAKEFDVGFLPDLEMRAGGEAADRAVAGLRDQLAGRASLYRLHQAEMLREGVADGFLAESARLHYALGELRQAADLAWRAVRLRPQALRRYPLLAKAMMGRVKLRREPVGQPNRPAAG